jgi:hypothetical protein
VSYKRIWSPYILSLTHSFIDPSMALQPFVGPWPLLHFRNLFYTDGKTPWTNAQSVARRTYTQDNTNRINAHRNVHELSGIRNYDPSVRARADSSRPSPRGHCDRHEALTHEGIYKYWGGKKHWNFMVHMWRNQKLYWHTGAGFWDVAPCSLGDTTLHPRRPCCNTHSLETSNLTM